MKIFSAGLGGLVEVFYPEQCAWCGAVFGDKPWLGCGERVPGLRRWDRPHACLACSDQLSRLPVMVKTLPGNLTAWAGTATSLELVQIISDWKYHGLRGLAWPLASLLANAHAEAMNNLVSSCVLVPVPLHRRRERKRGFNQAAILADLLSRSQEGVCAKNLLTRTRDTPQQAKIQGLGSRLANVDSAFACPDQAAQSPGVVLVDDLVTTGATVCAVAGTLSEAGIKVRGVLCLGLAQGRDS